MHDDSLYNDLRGTNSVLPNTELPILFDNHGTPVDPDGTPETFVIKRRIAEGLKRVVYEVHSPTRELFVAKLPHLRLLDEKYLDIDDAQRFELLKSSFAPEAAAFWSTGLSELTSISPRLKAIPERAFYTQRAGVVTVKDIPLICTLENIVPKSYKELTDLVKSPSPRCNVNNWYAIARAVAHTLCIVHGHRVVHCDIWPPNIFVHKDIEKGPFDRTQAQAALIDFGESWAVGSHAEFDIAPAKWQHPYRAPEALDRTGNLSEALDVYAFGALLARLAFGHPDYGNQQESRCTPFTMELLNWKLPSDTSAVTTLMRREWSTVENWLSNPQDHGAIPNFRNPHDYLSLATRVLLVNFLDQQLSQKGRSTTDLIEVLRKQLEYPGLAVLWSKAIGILKNLRLSPGIIQGIEGRDSWTMRTRFREEVAEADQAGNVLRQYPWVLDLVTSCCNPDPSRRPRMVDVARELEDQCTPSPSIPTSDEFLTSTKQGLETFVNYVHGKTQDYPILRHVVSYRLRTLADIAPVGDLSDTPGTIDQLLLDVFESRDVIIDHLCSIFGVLGQDDWFASLTTLSAWHSNAFGLDGRYLSSNLGAMLRRARLTRCFSISVEELGAAWWLEFLTLVGCEMMASDENKGHRNVLEERRSVFRPILKSRDFSSLKRNCESQVTDAQIKGYEALLSQLLNLLAEFDEDAVARALRPNGYESNEQVLSMSLVAVEELRKRFYRILHSYDSMFRIWNVGPNGGWGGILSSSGYPEAGFDAWVSEEAKGPNIDGIPTDTAQLFLGLCLRKSLQDRLADSKLGNRNVICHEGKIYLLESELTHGAKFLLDGRDVFDPSPKLQRVKVFVPHDETGQYTRAKLSSTFGVAVNIGPLVPFMVRAAKRMMHRKDRVQA